MLEYWADPRRSPPCCRRASSRYPDDPGRAPRCSSTGRAAPSTAASCSTRRAAQYHEFFIVVNALLDGRQVTTCPYIWVDRDFALARGWVQGFPKKLGSVWMTRTFGLDCLADPGLRPGARLRRHARRERPPARRGPRDARGPLRDGPTHNDPPLVNVRHFPQLAAGRARQPAVHELVGARSRDRSISPIWEGAAELELLRGAERGARRARPVRMGTRLPLHLRLHGRRPRRPGASLLEAA